MSNPYTIGCAALGALEAVRPKTTLGHYLPGIIHGDGSVPKKTWMIAGVAIGGLALAAILTSAKG